MPVDAQVVTAERPVRTPPAGVADLSAAQLRRRRIALRVVGYLGLLLISVTTAFPFVWMLLTSIRRRETVFAGRLLPDEITFDSYARAWSELDYPSHLLTSAVITTVTVVAVLALATLGGYAFAKLNFPGKQVIYLTLLSTLMLPVTAIILPLFLQMRTLNLLNTRQGLILVYVGTSLPFAMFLMRAFFETLPDELIQAARVDGAGEFTIFWRVMLPLAAPGVATVLIFQFLATWNEFLLAQTFLQNPDYLPLQPVLFSVQGHHSTDWPLLTAALTMSVLPVIAVYIRLQRRFVAGLTLGAVKLMSTGIRYIEIGVSDLARSLDFYRVCSTCIRPRTGRMPLGWPGWRPALRWSNWSRSVTGTSAAGSTTTCSAESAISASRSATSTCGRNGCATRACRSPWSRSTRSAACGWPSSRTRTARTWRSSTSISSTTRSPLPTWPSGNGRPRIAGRARRIRPSTTSR